MHRRYLLIGSIAAVVLTLGAIWLAFALVRPTPPRTVAMATDPESGISAGVAEQYRELLARDGIDLRLVPSVGAVENVARLRDPGSGISVAIIPGGITNRKDSPDLVSLGTLFYEPLWVFYYGMRQPDPHERVRDQSISIGPEGSGTRALSLQFLARVGIIDQRNTLLPLAPQAAAEKLLRGEINAVTMLGSWESPVVRQLLVAKDVTLVNIPRADAF